MRNYKKNIAILLSMVFVISIISAATFEYNTAINVRDSPNKELVIKTMNAETGTAIKSIPLTIDSSGFSSVEFQTNTQKIMLIVYEIQNKSNFLKPENIISNKEVGPFDTSQAINLNFIINQHNVIPGSQPEEEVPAKNETIVEKPIEKEPEPIIEEKIVEEEPKPLNEGLTGNVIGDLKSNFKFPVYYYFIGVGLFAMLIVSMVLKKKLSKNENKGFKVQSKETNKLDPDEEERELQDAEQRIKDAEEEISRIRNNKGKIREAEKNLKKLKKN